MEMFCKGGSTHFCFAIFAKEELRRNAKNCEKMRRRKKNREELRRFKKRKINPNKLRNETESEIPGKL